MADRKEVNEADLDWLAERDQPLNDMCPDCGSPTNHIDLEEPCHPPKVLPVPSVDIPENRPRFNFLFHWVCSKCSSPVTYREHYDDWVHTYTGTADCGVKPTLQQLLDGEL